MTHSKFLLLLTVSLLILLAPQATFSQSYFWIKTNAPANVVIYNIAISLNGYIFLATNGGVFRSTDYGNSWTSINGLPKGPSAFAINSSGHIFVGGQGVYRSTDNGNSWTAVGLSDKIIVALAINSKDQILAASSGTLFRSTDNGASWTPTGLQSISIYKIAINSSLHIFIGTTVFGGGIYRSTDNGNSWTPVNLGLPININVVSLATNPSGHIFAGINYLDQNQGYYGVFRSTNNGNSWTPVGLTNTNTVALAINSDGQIFAGGDGEGVHVSRDNGNTWTQINNGLTDTRIAAFAFNPDGFLFVAALNAIFHSVYSTTHIQRITDDVPNSFSLQQNYPNPFNPTTTINFALPKQESVLLKIYNSLGQEVETLVNEKLSAGSYRLTWNAASYAAGVYFYRLQAGQFVETKKLVLLK